MAQLSPKTNKRNYNSWNITETEKFIEGVKKYSRDFKEIATLVGTKEEKQVFFELVIQTHFSAFFNSINHDLRFDIIIIDY